MSGADRPRRLATVAQVRRILEHHLDVLWSDPERAVTLPPLMLWGAPGVGKSAVIQSVAADRQIGFVDVRLSQREPVDIRGLPVPKEDGVPPNRRYLHRGMYLPSRRAETLDIVIAIDTSLSTREHQAEFWSEILSLLRGYDDYDLCVITCDDRIRTVRTYSSSSPPDPTELVATGLGGTDFRPVFEWAAARPTLPRAVVFLTDGRGPAPLSAPPYPTLWVLTADGQRPTSWGRAIHLPARVTPEPGGA